MICMFSQKSRIRKHWMERESETEETGIQDMWRESCRYDFPLILLLLHFLK